MTRDLGKSISFLLVLTFNVVICIDAKALPNKAAIASAHPLASEAGVEILARGGNAFDAAVAVSAALGVVEPYGSGLGGGVFFLLHRASDSKYTMIDGREVAPLASTPDMYLDANGNPVPGASREGPLAAGIPGLPAALVHLAENYGRLSLSESLRPAIRLAEQGFPAYEWHLSRLERLSGSMNDSAKEVFLPMGEMPSVGDTIFQKDLGNTLRILASEGHKGFYRGLVAQKLLAAVENGGGIWSAVDLANYQIVEREPLIGFYRGISIISAPPPSAGGVALINMFNMLSGYEIQNLDTVMRVHLLVEIMRRAYRDRSQYLGDPDFVDMPLDMLLHPFYAAGQRTNLSIERSTPSISLSGIKPIQLIEGNQTSHFSVLDGEGNIVSATQSINFSYGSKYMADGTGVLLNNEMDDFSKKPGTPNGYGLVSSDANSIQPGKRMLSSMTPTILKSNEGVAILGSPGGSQIITMVFLAGLSWIEGANANEMVSRPRFHHQYLPDRIFFEAASLTDRERSVLESMGHRLELNERTVGNGNLQIVTWDQITNQVSGASDPRGIGEPRYFEP
ncbi:MAG: gamma-glutamyltransferase [Rhodospirillaceae bacterium]|nr:gamma-glutamyltransferase [Rhodospirillaceae bacterium]|tara:strand:- start:477 stop:2171 length:1695 start_codon:yes stop_codon:yes gene_type:complete